jgi:Uma2 family endonuclease
MGSRHAGTIEQLASLLSAAVGARAIVRSQLPLRLSDDSEPQPDIVLVVPSGDHYKSNHPSADHVLLLVEISDATLRYDREVKIPLYARHRVPEVWIVDLQARQIHFYRIPTAGEYADLLSDASPGRTAIASLPGVAVDLSPLLG